ncbi:MAG: DUF368 domain-containing protein [Lacrimispora sp.]|uniref:DUF368 domain-containing protein n=1 Tax=Lacrimispora sp. TaxID=2719234 RepID=UPI0039E23A0A
MRYINELLKGLIIGVANILPGISGGVLAISMGVYDKIIHAVNRLFKEPVKSLRILLPYGIGAVVGIVFLSLAFEYLFYTYPLQTKMAFLGMIGGGLPSLFRKGFPKGQKGKTAGLVTAFLTCAAVIFFTFGAEKMIASGQRGENLASGAAWLSSGTYWVPVLFLIGLIGAATMVIPGISGSMIMMMLGFYEPLLQTNNACIRALSSLDFNSLFTNGIVMVPYYAGLAVGVFLFARAVEWLLRCHERKMYQVIMGLVFSSPFVVLWDVTWSSVMTHQILAGISLSLLGYVCAVGLGGEG